MLLARYINREIFASALAVCVVLLVLTVFGRLSDFMGSVAKGELAGEYLLPMILYRLPQFLELILPFGLFLGALIAFRRLYAENEMVVIFAGGMGEGRLMVNLLPVATVVAIIVGTMSLWMTPVSMYRAYELLIDSDVYLKIQAQSTGRFQSSKDFSKVSYIGGVDQETKELSLIFVADLAAVEPGTSGDFEAFSTFIAPRATSTIDPETGDRLIGFLEGHHNQALIDGKNFHATRFSQYTRRERSSVNLPRIKSDAIATQTLLSSQAPEDMATLLWRVSLPMLTLIVFVMALPLSRTGPRGASNLGLIPAILVFISYLLLLGMLRSAVGKGDIQPISFAFLHLGYLLFALLSFPEIKLLLRRPLQRKVEKLRESCS